MNHKNIYEELDYSLNLFDLRGKHLKTNLEEFKILGVDKVYFSGDYPAIFFKEVKQFDDQVLKEIAQAHHLIWNYRKVMFLFVVSSAEIRIYNCVKKPFNYESDENKLEIELKKIEIVSEEVHSLQVIKELFSRIAVDSGVLWTTENHLRDEINIQKRIDRYLVSSLLSAAKEIRKSGLDDDVIHSLLMRSIFIMYLEDKGAAKETSLYTDINEDARSYIDILDSKSDTYKLFKILEDHFNGNVFPINSSKEKKVTNEHLQIIKKCLLDGDLSDDPKLFDWRLFRFNVIQIELLSEIYENFLEEFKSLKKEESGQYYTPPSLVELILNEKLKAKNETNWNIKILDPACGSGIFLVESFNRLVKRWKNANKGEKVEFTQLKKILLENIFGIEYDKYAIRVTAFSLYLAIVEHLNPRTLWKNKNCKFPYLINDPQDKTLVKQGSNLYRADTVGDINSDKFPKVDLVIGNPPFGSNIKMQSIKEFCKKYNYGQDMVIPFLRKAVEFTPEGSIALIFSTKILTNTAGPFQNFRRWLFNEAYVEKIYNLSIFRKAPKIFGGQLFTSAVGPISIVFYQKVTPRKPSNAIEYWAPKTYVKNNLIEGVVIDSTDIKFLPREECIKSETKIWKIAMWGSYMDFKLIEKLNTYSNFKVLISKNFKKGLGLQFLDESTKKTFVDNEIPKLLYIKPEAINRYYSTRDSFSRLVDGLTQKSIKKYKEFYNISETSDLNKINVFRRLGIDKEVYIGPHVLVKEGLKDKKLCASYIEESCSFNSKVFGISGEDGVTLKAITAFINSSLAMYYLFLISASIGIEREEIKPNELYELPFSLSKELILRLSEYVDKIIIEIKSNYPLQVDLSTIENSIDEEIYKYYKLTENDKILISDFFIFKLDLLFFGYNSSSLKPTSIDENTEYAKKICNEICVFMNSKMNISAEIYEPTKYNPLNLMILTLGTNAQNISKIKDHDFDTYLSEIDSYLLKKEAKNIYVKKELKYYDGNIIYIIKPNQKRFWSRSSAINDANELISEILKMQ